VVETLSVADVISNWSGLISSTSPESRTTPFVLVNVTCPCGLVKPLATCYGIITQSGGDIRVYSEPNAGTTFRIYLPRTDAAMDRLANPDANVLPVGTESLLVVEDDASVRVLITSVLSKLGYQVIEAGNPLDALALLENGSQFDLVVTDVIMPQMNGKDLYERIKAQKLEVKVLFISGYTDDALVNLGVLDGNLSFLEKPFSPARLAQTIRKVLDNDNRPGIPRRQSKRTGALSAGPNPAVRASSVRRKSTHQDVLI